MLRGPTHKVFIERMVLLSFKNVLPESKMNRDTYLDTIDIALIGFFCALWVTLNLALGPLSFKLLGLPILCDFAAFFSLLLVTWVTGRFGAASTVGIVGSIIVLLTGASPHVIGFAASAVVFDMLMCANHHKLHSKAHNMVIAAVVTTVSAYFAGAVIGIFFMGKPLDEATLRYALTFWGGWHLIGGIMSLAISLPIIGILEKASVRKIRSA